jgi:Zn-dependent protease with chaperone function
MRQLLAATFLLIVVSACSPTTYAVPRLESSDRVAPVDVPPPGGRARTRADYGRVLSRIEPAAEAICREEAPGKPRSYCDIRFVYDKNPKTPPNAFQTRGQDGGPLVVMTASLLGQMRTDDEIAVVLSHESAHHIARHLDRRAQGQLLGALSGGGIAVAAGGDLASSDSIRQAMELGAGVGGRVHSQSHELEADWLGAFIAGRAGYDPVSGARIFGRPALSSAGGPVVLSTHPASRQRQQVVAAAGREIKRQQAAGLVPRPEYTGN